MQDETPIPDHELCTIDDIVDGGIPLTALGEIPLSPGIRSLICLHDLNALHDLPLDVVATDTTGAATMAQTVLQRAFGHCIEWVFKNSRPGHVENQDLQSLWDRLAPIYQFSRAYSNAWDIMSALHKKSFKGYRNKAQEIIVRWPSTEWLRSDATDMLINSIGGTLENQLADKVNMTFSKNELFQSLAREDRPDGTSSLIVPFALVKALVDTTIEYYESHWEFDQQIEFDGYSIKELQQVWAAIQACAWIQQTVWIGVLRLVPTPKHFNAAVLCRSPDDWISEIMQLVSVPEAATKKILEQFTYTAGARYLGQPFFALPNQDLLAMSSATVLLSSGESLAWKVLSKNNKAKHSRLSSQKEAAWLSALTPWLAGVGLHVYGPFKYKHEGSQGDLDVLIVDWSDSFGLACEMKWLMVPDNVAGDDSTRAELGKARGQAKRAWAWANSQRDNLSQRMKVSKSEMSRIDLRPTVLCRSFMDSRDQEVVPCVSETFLKWVLGEPHQQSLRRLWECLSTKNYLAKENTHFRVEDGRTECSGLTFVCNGTVIVPTSPWDPKDISFDKPADLR